MSTLSFPFNCIILLVCFQEILSIPNISSSSSNNEGIEIVNGCACVQKLPKLNCPNQNHHSTSRDTSLGENYYFTPGIGAHKLHTRARTWNDARKVCIDEGGHLAIINSDAEERALLDIFKRTGPIKGSWVNDEAFLGIHDLFAEGDWTTVFGDSLAKAGFTTWSNKWSGQPDNWNNTQHCGAILKEGGMDDVTCNQPHAFFCELPNILFLNQDIS
ncbi:hemolymph lipopolysaccharide-binding protein-like [Megachile rotundata]|uniref:hemolymph lipopolysaccharide-binding protein-like n=1 Tax=Megachile rotundata TaxID=143995 RepID=UPI000258DA13|nr:PREDICTED: hemolymph lipopolysaccharide-binding protein-like [Megachile rotundata]